MSRLPARLLIPPLALLRGIFRFRRKIPEQPRRILILHSLLLGDSLLLIALVAKVRARYPDARILVSVPKPLIPLYATRPYGVEALPFNPKDFASVLGILRCGPYDLAIIPAENRHAWLARAAGARHSVAFSGDAPAWKNWMVDTLVPLPTSPMALADIFCTLLPGPAPRPYCAGDWPAPPLPEALTLPANAAIFHVTSSMATKQWPFLHWLELARRIRKIGLLPHWSVAPGEEPLLQELDPAQEFPHLALRFAPMWHALTQARILVSVDTSIVHLARLTETPSVVIFGPTDPELFGSGAFWHNHPNRSIYKPNVLCRNDGKLLRRPLKWVHICTRDTDRCAHPHCIHSLTVNQVECAVVELLESTQIHV